MPPKFQSSFIPKSVTVGVSTAPLARSSRPRNIFSLLAVSLFSLSLIFALGVFLYGFFLNYRITQMGTELEEARATLAPETVSELVDLSARLDSTDLLLKKHRVLSPVFKFLEVSTPKSVRYTDFGFSATNKGLELMLRGAAMDYASLAVAAESFNQNPVFQGPVFSDLRLDREEYVALGIKA